MAAIGYTDPLNLAQSRAGLIALAELNCYALTLAGKDDSNVFVIEDKPGVGRGSTIKRRFLKWNFAPTRSNRSTLGTGSNATVLEDSLDLRYFDHLREITNLVEEQQLVNFEIKNKELATCAVEWATWFERGVVAHMAGDTVVSTANNYEASLGNAVVAHDSDHIYRCKTGAGAVLSTDAAVAGDSTAILDSRSIDDLITRAASKDWIDPIAPAETPFGKKYILWAHPTGFQQLRNNSSDSDIYDLHKAAVSGGLDLSGSIFETGEGFIHNNTIVLRNPFMPKGITTGAYQANSRVAVFMGANAGAFAFGEGFAGSDNHLGYVETEILRQLSMLTDTVVGFKRTIVDSKSWAAIRVVHYSEV